MDWLRQQKNNAIFHTLVCVAIAFTSLFCIFAVFLELVSKTPGSDFFPVNFLISAVFALLFILSLCRIVARLLPAKCGECSGKAVYRKRKIDSYIKCIKCGYVNRDY